MNPLPLPQMSADNVSVVNVSTPELRAGLVTLRSPAVGLLGKSKYQPFLADAPLYVMAGPVTETVPDASVPVRCTRSVERETIDDDAVSSSAYCDCVAPGRLVSETPRYSPVPKNTITLPKGPEP